ncbi:MarR family winged helix-turn-helix transcriptional regulator [Sphingomonas sp. 28-62-11]|uniref:MarR family winged helix-turn-helix transcriptional regulator n=1 Tax=Sphingomonas sp. 28-62-11 TaxID=1970432 RepID=UPI000BDB020F|nr:MAG: hypothetical protein B7Y49_10380 [Sphingomonas sp. 28-62-11]
MTTEQQQTTREILFGFFNEIGIISQLSSALFQRLLPEGVHVAHFAIMNHMVRLGDDRTPQQLASAMQVTKATMTHSLKVLEARAFISVGPDPVDGRGKRVKLTAIGRQFHADAIALLDKGLAPIAPKLLALALPQATAELRNVRQILDHFRD